MYEKIIFIISLFARIKVSVERYASFEPLISVVGLNSQATARRGRRNARGGTALGARVGATLMYTRAQVAELGEKGAKNHGLFSGGRSNV